MRFDRDETSVLETQKPLTSERVVKVDHSPDIAHNVDEQQVSYNVQAHLLCLKRLSCCIIVYCSLISALRRVTAASSSSYLQ